MAGDTLAPPVFAAAAGGLALLPGLAPVDLHRLAAHRLASVRATAIDGWAAAEGQPPGLAAQLAADPSTPVCRRVAQFASTVLTRLGPTAAEPILEQLRPDRAWSVRYTSPVRSPSRQVATDRRPHPEQGQMVPPDNPQPLILALWAQGTAGNGRARPAAQAQSVPFRASGGLPGSDCGPEPHIGRGQHTANISAGAMDAQALRSRPDSR
jgi:hypothetical protein